MGAREYAEETLGVHDVHEQAVDAEVAFREALQAVVDATRDLRRIDDEIEHREFELASEIRIEHHGISQEALKRAIKEAAFTDDHLGQLRDDRREKQDAHDVADLEVQASKYRLRVLTARMNELGGLLNFYAVAKMPR